MKWEGDRESDNIEDRRDMDGGGGGGGLPFGGGRSIGLGTVAIALVASLVFGVNPLSVLNMLAGGGGDVAVQSAPDARYEQAPSQVHDTMAKFVAVVLADTEDTWQAIFKSQGKQYQNPKLVLFTGSTPTACGTGQSAAGPFYCPADQKVYIDLRFYELMKQRFHAPGDFAQAYVIAHEVGHHVQNLLGISGKVDAMRRRVSETEYNALSVRLELQADCLAGVWANHTQETKQFLEQGDIEEALNAATAIGDDTLQKESQGYAVPETFTHGSSAQRVRWFKQGMDSGDMNQCNTFQSKQL